MPLNRPSSPPPQPKRDYLKTMHRVAAGLGTVGRELTKGSDAHSPRKRMEKLGFGKTYDTGYRGAWSRPGERIAKLLRLSKGVPYWQKKTLEQEAENLDQKAESPKEQQVVDKELDIVARKLGKDPKVAQMWIDKVVENLRAGDRFSKGKRVPIAKVGEIVRGTSGIPTEVKEYFASVFGSQEQYQERVEDKGTTQGEIAAKIKELEARGVLKKSDVVEAEKKLGAREFSSDEKKLRNPEGKVKIHGWHVNVGNLSALTKWGKRSNSQNSAESKNADTKKVSP